MTGVRVKPKPQPPTVPAPSDSASSTTKAPDPYREAAWAKFRARLDDAVAELKGAL